MSIDPAVFNSPGSLDGIVASLSDLDRRVNALATARTFIGAGSISGGPSGTITAGSITATEIQTGNLTAASVLTQFLNAGNIETKYIVASSAQIDKLQAAHIASASITGGLIAGGTITGFNVQANTITGGLLSATAIDGMTITGATLRTAVGTGARIVMDTGGITAYNASNTPVLNFSTATGSLTLTGTVTANASSVIPTTALSGTLTTGQIGTGTVTSGNILDATITGGDVGVGTLTAANVATGTLTADKIAFNFGGGLNLIPDASYEVGTTGWAATNATAARSAAQALPTAGPNSVLLTAAAAGTVTWSNDAASPRPQAVPGAPHTASFWIYSSVARVCSVTIKFYNSGGSVIRTDSGVLANGASSFTSTASSWSRIIATSNGPTPIGTVSATVTLSIAGVATSETHYVDAVQFEIGGVASSWSQYVNPTVIDGSSITSATITASTFQTASSPSSRVVMDPTGMRYFDATNTETLRLSSATNGLQLLTSVAYLTPDADRSLSWRSSIAGGTEAGRITGFYDTTSFPGSTYYGLTLRSAPAQANASYILFQTLDTGGINNLSMQARSQNGSFNAGISMITNNTASQLSLDTNGAVIIGSSSTSVTVNGSGITSLNNTGGVSVANNMAINGWRMGDVGFGSTIMCLGHTGTWSTTGYGFAQANTGHVYINAGVAGQSIYFRTHNGGMFRMWQNPGAGEVLYNEGTGNTYIVNNAGTGVLLVNGSGGWLSTSDRRVKHNIADLGLGIEAVRKLRPVSFDLIAEPDFGQKQVGFIAQEVLPVFPEAVTERPNDGMYGLRYTDFVPLLAQGIKDVDSAQTTLEARVETLTVLLNELVKGTAEAVGKEKGARLTQRVNEVRTLCAELGMASS